MRGHLSIFREFVEFLRAEKKLWLLPLVFLLLLMGLIITLGEVTGLGPLIYTLF